MTPAPDALAFGRPGTPPDADALARICAGHDAYSLTDNKVTKTGAALFAKHSRYEVIGYVVFG